MTQEAFTKILAREAAAVKCNWKETDVREAVQLMENCGVRFNMLSANEPEYNSNLNQFAFRIKDSMYDSSPLLHVRVSENHISRIGLEITSNTAVNYFREKSQRRVEPFKHTYSSDTLLYALDSGRELVNKNNFDKIIFSRAELDKIKAQANSYIKSKGGTGFDNFSLKVAVQFETDTYNNPIKINLGNSYSVNEVKKAISKLFKLHPNLTSRILDDVELIGFDAKPSIEVGSIGDIGSFVRPFDLNHYLSRFLIVEDDNKSELYLCMDFHTLIFDPSSFNIVINTLLSILNGEYVEFVDDGVLRQISFEEVVNDSAYREHAQEFYNDFLVDKDESNDLVFSVDEDSSKIYFERFDFDNEYLTSFLSNHDITRNQFFTSVFAYTLSRFTGNSKVLFNLVTDGRAHLGLSDSVGMFSQTSPVIMDCENQSIDSFMDYSRELIDSLEIFDLYSFRELAFDYNWDNTISFVMLQDMFSSASGIEFEMLEKDLISNFSMALYYLKENTLGLNVVYSDEYSDNFVKHFVVSFKLILNGLIREKMLSDIQYTLESDIELLDSYNKTEYKLLFDDLIEAFI